MLVNGEKWACESCVKGHRVSGCNHRDRELIRIAPKGRPVKQCDHCRGARKSKSHHAKCDCGERREKSASDIKLEEHSPHCACYQGLKCVCGVKSESADPDLPPKPRPKVRPGLSSTHSESTLTVFANGHHKPCHRQNNLAHTSGAPYRIPRPHGPTHSASSMQSTDLENLYNRSDPRRLTQRSVDDLVLTSGQVSVPYGFNSGAQRSVDSLPLSRPNVTVGSDLFGFASNFSGFGASSDSMLDGASYTSTTQEPNVGQLSQASMWPEVPPSTQSIDEFQFSPADDTSGTEFDWTAISKPGLDDNALFAPTDLPLTQSAIDDGFTRPISHSGDSARFSAPGLTASSSGAQSELGDTAFLTDLDNLKHVAPSELLFGSPKVVSSASIEGLPYRIDTSVLSDSFRAPTSAPVQDNRLSLDLSILRQGNSIFTPDHQASLQSQEVPMNFWSDYAKSRLPMPAQSLSAGNVNFGRTPMSFEDDSRSLHIPASIEENPDDTAWFSGLRNELEQGTNSQQTSTDPLDSTIAWSSQS